MVGVIIARPFGRGLIALNGTAGGLPIEAIALPEDRWAGQLLCHSGRNSAFLDPPTFPDRLRQAGFVDVTPATAEWDLCFTAFRYHTTGTR